MAARTPVLFARYRNQRAYGSICDLGWNGRSTSVGFDHDIHSHDDAKVDMFVDATVADGPGFFPHEE